MEERKIKLFVDAHALDKEFQGTQTFICGLYNALIKKYSDVLDIYFGANDLRKVASVFPDVDASHILPYKKSKSKFLRLFTDIPHYVKKFQFDFAHFQNISLQQQVIAKNIVTLHDIIFDDFPKEFPAGYRQSRNFLFKRSLRQATVKTSVSNYSRERISQRYKITAEEINVIPNGADDLLTSCNLSRAEATISIKQKFGFENFILSVGRIEPRKNHLLLLDKYLQLDQLKRDIPLVFVGRKSIDVPELQNRISSLGNEQRKMFFWIEQVDRQDLIMLYKACRFFVYPSKAEGFGIPPLEAAVCKTPVLCSNATAMKDFAFFSPYVFDPNNEKEFEQKLLLMINTPPNETFMNQVSAEILNKYSWERSADIFYELLIKNKK